MGGSVLVGAFEIDTGRGRGPSSHLRSTVTCWTDRSVVVRAGQTVPDTGRGRLLTRGSSRWVDPVVDGVDGMGFDGGTPFR